MEVTDKQLFKIADLILTRLKLLKNNRHDEIQKQMYKVNLNLENLQTIRDGINKCKCFEWNRAAEKLAAKSQRILQDVPFTISELERTIKTSQAKLPSLRQIYEEIKQVQEEFGRMEYDRNNRTLSIFTDPIEMEGIFLGDFEIQLQIFDIANIQNGTTVKIIALDAHPAASSDDVTHPHVSDEYLCAGDASVPMHNALLDGRICDYFMLIKSVLETYNPSSPYVALDQWDGYACYDCGYTTDDENSFYCEACDCTFCNECYSYCHCCDTSLCHGCLKSCPICGETVCESCLKTCNECGELVCESCIDDELCPTCKEESEAQDEEVEEEPVRTEQVA